MDKIVVDLVERFNAEFPNGDSLELAQYIYAHANDENPDGVIQAHPNDDIEIISVPLWRYPKALENKVQEWLEEGNAETREQAESYLRYTNIQLEVYYEKGQGMFCVESDALDGGADLVSPYTRKPIIVPDDDQELD